MVQANRVGTWGSHHEAAIGQGALLGYGELYALWERQNWKAHELDFSVDKEQWLADARPRRSSTWSGRSARSRIGEERVTADLAPFLSAAPSRRGRDLPRHPARRRGAPRRLLRPLRRRGAWRSSADDLRGRMRELRRAMMTPWFDVFDDGLRDIANRIKENPDDLALFVEGITTYHLVIEGVLAMTGQRFILEYLEDHDLSRASGKGFGLVEQDEHRHIAFGVRFLQGDARAGPVARADRRAPVAELVPQGGARVRAAVRRVAAATSSPTASTPRRSTASRTAT